MSLVWAVLPSPVEWASVGVSWFWLGWFDKTYNQVVPASFRRGEDFSPNASALPGLLASPLCHLKGYRFPALGFSPLSEVQLQVSSEATVLLVGKRAPPLHSRWSGLISSQVLLTIQFYTRQHKFLQGIEGPPGSMLIMFFRPFQGRLALSSTAWPFPLIRRSFPRCTMVG